MIMMEVGYKSKLDVLRFKPFFAHIFNKEISLLKKP